MATPPDISVILCTHNPRAEFLRQTLDALKAQTLPPARWELLLVDNASKEPLAERWDLSWHPQARHVREEALGLTPARLRGIAGARAPLLVFVDDDNLLAPDYLGRALEIAAGFPHLGAWGGNLVARYEAPPPEWVKPYVAMLAVRAVERDAWSNLLRSMETCPAGAGMCIRAHVARRYADSVANDPRRRDLDRKGRSLVSCGDLDMAYTACDMGLGTGVFTRLSLEHIIPPGRLQKDYLLRLREANGYSRVMLNSFRGVDPVLTPERRPSPLRRLREWLLSLPGINPPSRRIAREFTLAQRRGREKALRDLGSAG